MMWRLLIALIGLSMTDVNSYAQLNQTGGETPRAEGLASGCPPSEIGGHNSCPGHLVNGNLEHGDADVHAGYIGPSGVVRFLLIQGRICLDPPRHRKGAQSSRKNGVYESVSVTAKRGIPSVHYVSKTNHQNLTLIVQDAHAMRMESEFLGRDDDRQYCVITQPASGPITISCTSDNQSHEWTGSTLIHVRGVHPVLFDQHFGPLMTRMLHGHSMKELSDRTRAAALAELHSPIRITESEIDRWVVGLGSDQRRQRIDAQRKLINAGTLAIPILRSRQKAGPEAENLDAEQMARINRILVQLRSQSPDRPRSLAKLLVNDPSYWSILADRISIEEQQLVVSHQAIFRDLSPAKRPPERRPVIRVAGR